jgi:hypothetical protein
MTKFIILTYFLFKMKAWKLLSQLGGLVKGEFPVIWEDGIKPDLRSLHAVMSLVGSTWVVLPCCCDLCAKGYAGRMSDVLIPLAFCNMKLMWS